MTYNIRYGTAPDGANAWEHRREALAGLIRERNPDILCVQEALRGQLDYLAESLPNYSEIGVGRDDGKTAGEYAAILYRKSRFEPLESGTFWLSESPDQPGSRSWGAACTRICTWALFREKAVSCPVVAPGQPMATPTPGAPFAISNLHLDHQSPPARAHAVEMLADRLGPRLAAGVPVIVCGDFNAGEANPAMRYLRGEVARASEGDGKVPASPRLADTFRSLHPGEKSVGTFNGFKPATDAAAATGDKIDYILVPSGPRIQTLEASIDRTASDGRFPSDHFPVIATVRVQAMLEPTER